MRRASLSNCSFTLIVVRIVRPPALRNEVYII